MHRDPPKVSVIVPAYNARAHIGEALDSIHGQGYDNLEVIVVDDGSQDGTADHVETGWPWVQVIRKENGGAASARNAGLRNASGDLIAFMDADDLWLPEKLHIQTQFLQQHPEAAIVCSGFKVWQPSEAGVYPSPDKLETGIKASDSAINPEYSGWIYHKLLLDSFVWTSTVMMRRSLVEQVGEFDESLRLGQDYDYWLRVAQISQIHTLQRPLALYRQHAQSATARGARINYGAKVLTMALERWGTASPNGASIPRRQVLHRIANIHFANGFHHYRLGDFRLARPAFANAVRMNPMQARWWPYLFLASLRSRLPGHGKPQQEIDTKAD